MSSNEVTKNNGQQAQVNTNLAKLFPFEKELRQYNYTPYEDTEISAGTVMGVVKATGEVIPFQSDASDGSQLPIGVLAEDYSIDGGDTVAVCIGITGTRVRQNMLVFEKDGDDLETVVDDRRVLEWLFVAGIIPISSTNATTFDNEI